MCGIAGVFSQNNTVKKEMVELMTKSIAHRGPDAEGFCQSPSANCVLGHRRLSIIDLSSGANQPLQSDCGRFAIIFNGEVYNYQEIRADIDRYRKIKWKTNSDTEVILEAFATWGKQFVYKLNGMFAIAIFDLQDNVLWLFRDRMGIKPIYYYFKNGLFAFASELKAFLAIKDELGKLTINQQAVIQFLRLGYIPSPNSIFNEIKKFPAASYGAVNEVSLNIECYWDIKKKVIDTTFGDEHKMKDKLRSLIESSVQYRMISDVPFGTFLSGGIDSSTVTALAQSLSNKPINTFTISFKENDFNESKYANDVAKHLKTNHHELELSYKDAIAMFDDILESYDEPFADSSAIPTMLVSKFAKQHVTMTLSGDGGDEQFMGYGSYTWAKRLDNPLNNAFKSQIAWALSKSNNTRKRASEHFRWEDKNSLMSHIFSVEQYLFSERELNDILISKDNSNLHIEENVNLSRKLTVEENQAFFDLRYYLPDDLLVKVDRASMKYGLETRVPLLDHRIVEFSLNLSQNLKLRNNESKYLLKEVLFEYVPRELFNRPKWGFSLPLKHWLKNELSYLRTNYLDERLIERHGIFNVNKVKELEKRYLEGEDYLYNKLWQIIILTQWIQKNHAE